MRFPWFERKEVDFVTFNESDLKENFFKYVVRFTFVRMICIVMVLKCIRSSAWIVGVGGLKILVILVLTPFVLLKVSCCSSRVGIPIV